MNGECLYAAILQLLGKCGDYQIVAIPPEAGFHRHRNLHRIHHGARDVEQQRYVAKHARTGSFVSHFLYRTAEIDVEDVGTGSLGYLGSLHHRIHISAVDLNRRRAFSGLYAKLSGGAVDVSYQCIGRNKLGVHHIGTLLATNQSERGIGNVLHGSQHHRTGA